MNITNFAHVTSLFLSNNDKTLKSHSVIQQKKFHKLCTEQFPRHDPSSIIFNFSNYKLPCSKKSLLIKGSNFSSPPKKLNYADFFNTNM